MPHNEFAIFAGTVNPELAVAVAADLGVALGTCAIQRFPDGETSIQLQESVRRKEVFLVQPLSPPANEHLVEWLALADACRRAAAWRITAVVPLGAMRGLTSAMDGASRSWDGWLRTCWRPWGFITW